MKRHTNRKWDNFEILAKIKSSGKKDGNGGMEALLISSLPISNVNSAILFVEKIRNPSRVVYAPLVRPTLKNIPMEAHPCARDSRAMLR